MKKSYFLKTIFLLCALLAGVVNVNAQEGYDYEWVETDFSQLATGDVVVLVDNNYGSIALPNNDSDFKGVSVTVRGNKLSGTISESIQWTLTKDGSTVKLNKDNTHALVVSGTTLSVQASTPTAFTYNSGQLSYNSNNIAWSYVTYYQAVLQGGSYQAGFTFYKKVVKNYVKWKRVNFNDLQHANIIAIVDLTTGLAMTNDKGSDKKPGTVAVELNADKDRIIGSEENNELTDKILWIAENDAENFKFRVVYDNKWLQYDDSKLSVGENEEKAIKFIGIENNCLKTVQIGGKTYYAGVKAGFMSNTWELLEAGEGGAVSDDIKDTQIAIFKKVEDAQKNTTLKFASDNFAANLSAESLTLSITCTGAPTDAIQWTSSDESVATVNEEGVVTLKKRGTVTITASVAENEYHDKASATCTVRIDDSNAQVPGSINNPFTVAQAKELAEKGEVTIAGTKYTLQEGVNYYVKGKVSKVNSGLMAMFGDMDMGSIGGTSGMDFDDMMDDMDFDMDSMDDMGFDMSSLGFDFSSIFGSSDKVTYYISDDGTKDNQLKVVNGLGTIKSNNGGAVEYNNIPNLSPGDCVVVCGPLVYSEDTNALSSLMGGSSSTEEPKNTAKVDELNYLYQFDPTLLVEDKEVYVNKTLDGSVTEPLGVNNLYTIDNLFEAYNETKITQGTGTGVQAPTFKSSDEEIAKWDEDAKKIIGVNEGTAKITVKVKVILQADDPNTTDTNEEKSYTMKRKFKLTVKTRDLDPAGYYDGHYHVTASTTDLEEGSRLILVGTRVKDGNSTDYIMGENNSMMGGGKTGTKATINYYEIPCKDVPKGTLEIVLEKDGDYWNLNVGQDEKGNKLYLYATSKDADNNDMMEMFSPSSGLKVGTKADADKDAEEDGVTVSMKASIAISVKSLISYATIKFDGISNENNNTIMLSSAFDMESMMNMGGSGSGTGGGEQSGGSSTSTFDMGSFDLFMASFNTKKPGSETPEEGKDQKNFLPRIYRFVPDASFGITIGNTGWKTIVTYKDVEVPENVEAYIVTKVQPEETQSVATLLSVEKIKGGVPYLLHVTSGSATDYTMTLTSDEVTAPTNNMLEVSDRTTTGSSTSSTVYVLANKSKGVGFYRWTGDKLGAGRVYLPVGTAGAPEYCGFYISEATAIQSIDDTKTDVGPFYDLQGRRVEHPTNGIYIVNGKKVVVK